MKPQRLGVLGAALWLAAVAPPGQGALAQGSLGIAAGASADDPAPAPAWAVDPKSPGEDRPAAGRSLFDRLVAVERDGKRVLEVPFPFTALLGRIEARLAPPPSGGSPLKRVLIPLGRSLQRHAAAPAYFSYPRVVVAVDGEPRAGPGEAGLLLKDRLYLGYQEKAELIEVISYNEAAGRFEFQVVKDYRPGRQARVLYARRALCLGCHQNAAPIFSEPLWEETNANPEIARRLEAEGRAFHGIVPDQGVKRIEAPFAIGNAAERANLFAAHQRLWREGCQAPARAAACRAALLTALLQYRLSGRQHFDASPDRYQEAFAAVLARQGRARWPGGLAVPDSRIANRNPILAPAEVTAAFDPLNPRPPLETWSPERPRDVRGLVAGLSEFLAEADIRRLDDHLFETGLKGESPRQRHRSRCAFTVKDMLGDPRMTFECRVASGAGGQGFAMDGRFFVREGAVHRGVIDRLSIGGTEQLPQLKITGGRIEGRGERWLASLRVVQHFSGLHGRRADGRALEALSLSWPRRAASGGRPFEETMDRSFVGTATLTVMDDFAPVHAAIAELARRTEAGHLDVFSAKPFRRGAVIRALFDRLGMAPLDWCCAASGLPPAQVDAYAGGEPAALSLADPLHTFFRYCATCHRTAERFPPNFLHGGARQVAAKLAHCAERISFRLRMWQLPGQGRPKTPMPPVNALEGFGMDPEQWRESAELAGLRGYVSRLLRSEGGAAPAGRTQRARDYHTLRDCLPSEE